MTAPDGPDGSDGSERRWSIMTALTIGLGMVDLGLALDGHWSIAVASSIGYVVGLGVAWIGAWWHGALED
jgi:hypothetical protein